MSATLTQVSAEGLVGFAAEVTTALARRISSRPALRSSMRKHDVGGRVRRGPGAQHPALDVVELEPGLGSVVTDPPPRFASRRRDDVLPEALQALVAPNSVLKTVESTTSTSPARSPAGGIQRNVLNSLVARRP